MSGHAASLAATQLQCDHLRFMPGNRAIETNQMVADSPELRRQLHQLAEQTFAGVDLLDGDIDATLGEGRDGSDDF